MQKGLGRQQGRALEAEKEERGLLCGWDDGFTYFVIPYAMRDLARTFSRPSRQKSRHPRT